jgi:hypothetical protein
MKKRFVLIFFTLFLALCASIFAQNRDYKPYVTQIEVESVNNLIKITWIDSADARGPVYIYRAVRPFFGAIPANIKPIAVKYGDQYYIDDSDGVENIFYFIAASDISGQRYDIILPMINCTSLVSDRYQKLANVSTDRDMFADEPIEGIYNLRASQDKERVLITFNRESSRRTAILYRSMQPVTRPQDLINAVIVQSGVNSPFVDFPVSAAGLAWYYAVVYEDDVAGGNVDIKPGINATVLPVTVTGAQTAESSLRPIPLPVLTLRNTIPESYFMTEIPEQVSLSETSANMLRDTEMPPKLPLNLKRPRIFSVDLVSPSGGEESALFQIITEYFVTFQWDAARIGLQQYLSLPRSKEVEARARFYLGQTLYYTGKYRESLMEFLSVRSAHLAEANKWVEAVLSAMVY